MVYSSKKTQIAHLKVDETSSKVLSKYADFAAFFFTKIGYRAPQTHGNQ